MNRRQLIKGVIGVAVATAIPAMPFVWEELGHIKREGNQVLLGVRAVHNIAKGMIVQIDQATFTAKVFNDLSGMMGIANDWFAAGQYGYVVIQGSASVMTANIHTARLKARDALLSSDPPQLETG